MTKFHFDGAQIPFEPGDTVAAALLRNQIKNFRQTRFNNEARSLFCGIGHCYDCLVNVVGKGSLRACLLQAEAEMQIKSTLGIDG